MNSFFQQETKEKTLLKSGKAPLSKSDSSKKKKREEEKEAKLKLKEQVEAYMQSLEGKELNETIRKVQRALHKKMTQEEKTLTFPGAEEPVKVTAEFFLGSCASHQEEENKEKKKEKKEKGEDNRPVKNPVFLTLDYLKMIYREFRRRVAEGVEEKEEEEKEVSEEDLFSDPSWTKAFKSLVNSQLTVLRNNNKKTVEGQKFFSIPEPTRRRFVEKMLKLSLQIYTELCKKAEETGVSWEELERGHFFLNITSFSN